MKTLHMTAVLFFAVTTMAQETSDAAALGVIKNIYGNEVEAMMGYLHQQSEQNSDVSDEKSTPKTLYKRILNTYKKSFSDKELSELFAFYQSATGKKLLQQKDSIANAVSMHIFDQERELMEIEIPEPMDESTYLKMIDSIQTSEVKSDELMVEVTPEINSLEDLQKHLKKHPYDVNNIDLLKAILGTEVDIDSLFMPMMEEFEAVKMNTDGKM